MPARKKTLEDFVRDRTFLARRHRALLASSPPLADPELRALQERYCAEQDILEQLQIARALERPISDPRPRMGRLLPGRGGIAFPDASAPSRPIRLVTAVDRSVA